MELSPAHLSGTVAVRRNSPVNNLPVAAIIMPPNRTEAGNLPRFWQDCCILHIHVPCRVTCAEGSEVDRQVPVEWWGEGL
jgi:hypothetical protein